MAESPSPVPAVRLRHLRRSAPHRRGLRPAARPESPVSGGGLPTTIGVFALLRYRHPDLDDRALRRLLHRLLPMARGLARFVGIDVTALTVGHFVLAVRQDGFHLAADVAEYLRSLDEHGSSTAVSATTRTSLALPTNRTP